MKQTPLLVLLSLASSTFANKCECGYSVNNTNAQQFGLFTELEETDFFHTASVDATARIGTTRWDAQVYNRTAEQVGRLIGFSKQLGNVMTNPLPEGKWDGPPLGVGDAGLQLWVRHAVENDLVSVAGIDDAYNPGNTSQMIYGSFRAAIKFSGMKGTRGGFSWQSASEEREQYIGIEFAARESDTVRMDVYDKPASEGGNSTRQDKDKAAKKSETSYGTAYISVMELPEEFHEYRFDWLPDRVDFYVDGMLMQTESECVPNTPGTLALRHFEDNDRDEPPAQDAVMTVGYVKAYYNATTRDHAKPGCSNLDNSVCVVRDQNRPPNPDGQKTHFYSSGQEEEKDEGKPDPGAVGNGWTFDNGSAVSGTGLLIASFLVILAYGLL